MASSKQGLPNHRKLALIIGNGDYSRRENRIGDSVKNAQELNNVLRTMGFNVKIACNLSSHQMNTEIIDFTKMVNDGDIVLFYFSGHGYQVKGKNYLMSIDDAEIESNRDVEDFAVDVDQVLLTRLANRNPSYVNVMILDCCRPYVLKGASAATCNGLQEMTAHKGTFVQFACATNQTVTNDLFTKHLLKNIAQESTDITEIFQCIENDVYRESNKKQRPLSMTGLNHHKEVYLNASDLSTAKFLSKEPLSADEKNFYDDCKVYYHLTKQPLVSIANEVFDNNTELPSTSIKFGVDEDCSKFDLRDFLGKICDKTNLKLNDMVVKKIQTGSVIYEAELYNKLESKDKKLRIKMFVDNMNDNAQKELGQMKVFFMYMGPIQSLGKMQKYRAEIKLHPQFNRIYARGHNYWQGAIDDGKDRGNKPYYCPVGWQRKSFYVSDNFDKKFQGWCICYHGTKFAHGLSILLSGLKPADKAVHGSGIYATPSVNYASHPRYSEIKQIEPSSGEKFFKSGKYVQFVLECRVHPDSILKIVKETLRAHGTTIDPNIDNSVIEWLIDDQNKSVVNFNDPDSSIVCTGLLTRVTDEHPGLLPESQWWYTSHICENPQCCSLSIDLDSLTEQIQNGDSCNIIFT